MAQPNSQKGPTNEVISGRSNTLGITQNVLDALLDKLDTEEAKTGTGKRVFARWPYRKLAVDLEIQQPGGTMNTLRVVSRNLSRSGMSVLHTGFMHSRCKCTVRLTGIDGQVRPLSGTIARCTHRGGRVHEIGIRFDKPIDSRTFFDGRTASRMVSMERVDPQSLKGTVLCCVRSDAEHQLVRSLLADTSLSVRRATVEEINDPKKYEGICLLLIGQSQEGESGTMRLRSLRELGVGTPALVLTADIEGPPREGLWDLPDVALAATPIPKAAFLATIAEVLLIRVQDNMGNGIESLDTTTASSVRVALQELRDRISIAMANKEMAKVEQLATRLAECARMGKLHDIATMADRLKGVALLGNETETEAASLRILTMVDTFMKARAA